MKIYNRQLVVKVYFRRRFVLGCEWSLSCRLPLASLRSLLRPHIMHDNCFSEPEDMSLWNCMVLNGIFMFLFNEESRKCSGPIVQNYNKNQFCAHKQIRNKSFMNYALHSCKVENFASPVPKPLVPKLPRPTPT